MQDVLRAKNKAIGETLHQEFREAIETQRFDHLILDSRDPDEEYREQYQPGEIIITGSAFYTVSGWPHRPDVVYSPE